MSYNTSISMPKRRDKFKTSISVSRPEENIKRTISFSENTKNKLDKLHCSVTQNEEHILFVGDTSFGDNYILEYENREEWGFNLLKEYGHDYFFKNLKGILFDADTVIANLETPLLNNEMTTTPSYSFSPNSKYVMKQGRFLHWSNGANTVEYLKKNNIRIVSLANNHMLDYGRDGFIQTMSILKKGAIRFFGANRNAQRAKMPFERNFIVGNRKIKLVTISAFEDREAYSIDFGFYAGRDKPGVNKLSIKKIKELINNLRRSAPNEVFVVAFPHWGGRRNYGWRTKSQIIMGHKLIRAGADIVIGTGPHNLQEIEEYQGHLILYSIGNFMYNSLGNYDKYNAPPFSLAVELIFRNEESSSTRPEPVPSRTDTVVSGLKKLIKLYPIVTDNNLTKFQTRLVNNDEFNLMYKTLIERSLSFKPKKTQFRAGMDKIGRYIELSLS